MAKYLGLIFILLTGCSLSSWNPANDPSKVPSSFGPCGSWVTCTDTTPFTCCRPTEACATDDGGPYCAADETYDPSDPVTWARKIRHERAKAGP